MPKYDLECSISIEADGAEHAAAMAVIAMIGSGFPVKNFLTSFRVKDESGSVETVDLRALATNSDFMSALELEIERLPDVYLDDANAFSNYDSIHPSEFLWPILYQMRKSET